MNDTINHAINDTIIKVSRNTDIAPQNLLSTQTVAFSHYNYISAQLPVNITTGDLVANDIKVQAAQCLKNIKTIVESIDHDMNDVIKINIFLKNIADIKEIDTIYPAFFQGYLPTRTVIAVAALPMDNALVQMDAVISNGEGTYPQSPVELVKVPKNNEKVPKDSVSPHTIAFSHYNNISAQLPVDIETGELVAGGVKEQTQQCLQNIEAILESIDVPLYEIVKVNIFLKNLADVDVVNDVYKEFFPESTSDGSAGYLPALTMVIASDLQLNALVQIDAIVSHGNGTPPQAVEDKHGITIKANNTDKAPKNPLSTQTVAFSHYNHLSGQLPINPETGKLIDGDIKAQTKQCLENIKAIVESIDHVMDDVVKMTIQLTDITDIDAVNDIYKTFFNSDLPARTVIGVAAIPMDALIQIDTVVSNAEGTSPT